MKRLFFAITLVSIFSCKMPFGSYPELTGPVVDPSGYLPIDTKSKLETILLEEEKITSNQVVIYITESLRESTIEREAVAVFEQWKLGQKDKDNGILLLLAPNDKKVRIEVGYGLESILTDLIAKRIIDEIIIPNMKAGNPSMAMISGVTAILEQLRTQSPKLTNENCAKPFSDTNSELHSDTIPYLIKETKSIRSIDFKFCVLPLESQFALEGAANHLLLQQQKSSQNVSSVIFVTSPKNEYKGTIVTSPDFYWSLSQNKIRSIFRNRYQESRTGDFTNYTYRAYLDMLDHIRHNNKIEIEKGTGIYDPYDSLERFSYDRAGETIRKLETEYKIGIQILFLDTKSDLTEEGKKYHQLAFGKSPGITLLFSLNQKKFLVYTDQNSMVESTNGSTSYLIETSKLEQTITNAITSELKVADIDWICIRSAEGIDTYLNSLRYQKDFNYENSSQSTSSNSITNINIKEPHFVFQLFFMLMFFFLWIGLASGEGIIFFYGLFYVIGVIIRTKMYLLPDSPNIYVMFSMLVSAILTTIFSFIFRKLGWSTTVSSHTRDFFTSSGSSSSSGSGSSYRSSGSSYSGGGGRSGGGGASGSWS
ncbi:TPM domain-containing protein [Leptospira paudalimensis]|uniref:TPM domain-containing protein n=1 Tax=Leptospira paudalimensis TaxID=2950024 RepID=A0ABT3M8G1_9LEPT|nr:TPM domain-containing protein [Leptospira paudalimensis]MCW7504672.1 TPM domain-containing protein [Leptospira paudalimensis]